MALEWYSTTSLSAQQSDYRITKSTIVITATGIFKILDNTTRVKLGYDADRNVIGIAPADAGDKTAFKLARRRRGIQHQVSAKKFFDRFGLSPATETVEGNFEVEGDIVFASLASSAVPKRRRRTKAEMAESVLV